MTNKLTNKPIKLRIKTGDKVIVTTGKDKGKTGNIIKVMPKEGRVIVKGINMAKRHVRPTAKDAGGIIAKELSIHISNIAYFDETKSTASRVGYKHIDGKKVRYCKASGETILDKITG